MHLWSTEVQRLVRHFFFLLFILVIISAIKNKMELKCDTNECITQKSICSRCAKFALTKAKNAGRAEKNLKTIVTHYGTVIVLKMQINGSHNDRGSGSFRNCVEIVVAKCVCECVCCRNRHRIHKHTRHPPITITYCCFVWCSSFCINWCTKIEREVFFPVLSSGFRFDARAVFLNWILCVHWEKENHCIYQTDRRKVNAIDGWHMF